MDNSIQVFVFLGAPGSGKGSLSQLCAQRFDWKRLSTGNLCRKHIVEKTKIGQTIDFAIKSGKLVSDELVTKMVDEWFGRLTKNVQAVILDGYPRTVAQAQELDALLKHKLKFLRLHVVKLDISDTLVIQRLEKRYICSNKDCQMVYSLEKGSSLAPKKLTECNKCEQPLGRRKDDEKNAVRERLKTYYKHEQNLLSFYKKIGQPIIKFNVEMALENVFNEFTKKMGFSV